MWWSSSVRWRTRIFLILDGCCHDLWSHNPSVSSLTPGRTWTLTCLQTQVNRKSVRHTVCVTDLLPMNLRGAVLTRWTTDTRINSHRSSILGPMHVSSLKQGWMSGLMCVCVSVTKTNNLDFEKFHGLFWVCWNVCVCLVWNPCWVFQ